MTRLSVNINKIATLRNARGGNIPNVLEAAENCEKFGYKPEHILPHDSYLINLGNPVEYNLLELANLILKMTKSESKIIFKPLPLGLGVVKW